MNPSVVLHAEIGLPCELAIPRTGEGLHVLVHTRRCKLDDLLCKSGSLDHIVPLVLITVVKISQWIYIACTVEISVALRLGDPPHHQLEL